MSLGLADELLLRSEGRPEKANDWLTGAIIKSRSLVNDGRHGEAEALGTATKSSVTETGAACDRKLMAMLMTCTSVAMTGQGKHVDALPILESCVEINKLEHGPDHMHTLQSALLLAENLRVQGKHAEATTILRDVLERAKRTLGHSEEFTLDVGIRLAVLFDAQGMHDESLALFREGLPAMKRVLGKNHVATLQACTRYAIALDSADQPAEAEAVLIETVAGWKAACGSEHHQTRFAENMLAAFRGDADDTPTLKVIEK